MHCRHPACQARLELCCGLVVDLIQVHMQMDDYDEANYWPVQGLMCADNLACFTSTDPAVRAKVYYSGALVAKHRGCFRVGIMDLEKALEVIPGDTAVQAELEGADPKQYVMS